ncbi:MAG: hypothetical protein AB1601_10800 [Planctomycetota bacterium]
MKKKDMIAVWATPLAEEGKPALPRLARGSTSVVEIGSETIAKNLKRFLSSFQPILDAQDSTSTNFDIEEVEVHLTVNASGGVELVGKLETGAEASIKLTLRRRRPT